MRTVKKINCEICGREFSSNGIGNHIKNYHEMTIDEYVHKYGEYRINKLRAAEVLENSTDKFKCLLDGGDKLYTERALTYHLKVNHGITKQEYILNNLLGGIKPTCKCGCGNPVKINSYKHPHYNEFLTGHNAVGKLNPMYGKFHSNDSKTTMRKKAKKRCDDAKEKNKTLHWHTTESIKKRSLKYSETMFLKRAKDKNVTIISDKTDLSNKVFKYKCNKCDTKYEERNYCSLVCTKCYPIVRSKYEVEIGEFLKSLNIVFKPNARKVLDNKYELDFYIPSKNMGIEFHGLYYHSEINGGKDKHYHNNKLKMCSDKGISLIQIFEDEWVNSKNIVKSRLKHKLGVLPDKTYYGRNITIREIPTKQKSLFLKENHIQGNDKPVIKLGAFHRNELVSVMTFSNPSISKGSTNNENLNYELSRFCSLINCRCVGVFSKMLKYFISNFDVNKIITFADRRFSSEHTVYEKCGFYRLSITEPNYWYFNTKDIKRYHRFAFNKQVIINKYGGDPLLTEWENMKSMNFDRVWDCGSIKYEYVPKKEVSPKGHLCKN